MFFGPKETILWDQMFTVFHQDDGAFPIKKVNFTLFYFSNNHYFFFEICNDTDNYERESRSTVSQ